MLELPANVKQNIKRYVPSSLAGEITCLVFFDHYPLSEKSIDVTICTTKREVIELYKREVVTSVTLETSLQPNKITIYRNNNGSLYYLVQAGSELFIVCSEKSDRLQVVKKLDGVESFDINDEQCTGEALLQVKLIDDAVPLILNINFEVVSQSNCDKINGNNEATSPLVVELQRQLKSARYSVVENEKILKERRDLRCNVAIETYQKMHPISDDSAFKCNTPHSNAGGIKIKDGYPQIKLFGSYMVMEVAICAVVKLEVDNIYILLETPNTALSYQTKVYASIETAPYWQQIESQFTMKPAYSTSLVVSIEMKHLDSYLQSETSIGGVIVYKTGELEMMIPFETQKLSMGELFQEEINLFSNSFDKQDLLAILATSTKTDILIRNIKSDSLESDISMSKVLCSNLHFQSICGATNVLIHKTSPFHILHGVLVIIKDGKDTGNEIEAEVYSRTPSQIIGLIHAIYDLAPHRVLITTTNHMVKLKSETTITNDRNLPKKNLNTEGHANSLLKQMDLLKAYYDNCMIKMNENRDGASVSRIGKEIDLLAPGLLDYEEFKTNFKIEVETGFKCLTDNNLLPEKQDCSNSIFMDTDDY